jgi:hypothetical protein
MLKKIQNVWNFILKKKKITNQVNLYSIKNNYQFANEISNSLVFFINTINGLKLKNIKTLEKSKILPHIFFFIYFIIFIIFISFILYLFILF